MTLTPDTPIRLVAQAYLERVRSNLPLATSGLGEAKAALYAEFTGNNQQYYDKMYPSGNFTGCNAFAGTYCKTGLGGGRGPFAGGFFMDSANPKEFVSSQDAWPRYGDICLQADRRHVFVILNDDPLTTIQAGWNGSGRKAVIDAQTGKQAIDEKTKEAKWTGIDTIGVSEGGSFDPNSVLGWLDIDKLFPDRSTVPYWVLGWWRVDWDEDTYYYYFGTDKQVYWTERKPRTVTEICSNVPSDGGVGRFTVDHSLNISWRSGSKEQFWYGKTSWPEEFWGNHNGKDVLHVRRMS